jgi:hypothetical protein
MSVLCISFANTSISLDNLVDNMYISAMPYVQNMVLFLFYNFQKLIWKQMITLLAVHHLHDSATSVGHNLPALI